MIRLRPLALAALVAAPGLSAGLSAAADEPGYALTIRDHRFEPDRLTIPAGKEISLVVTNADATPEEFESHELNREKIVPGGGSVTVLIGPLEPGEYTFVGEFHEDTAKGVLVVE